MKELLEAIMRDISANIHSGDYEVDYRNKAFVRVKMSDGLQVDLHKYGDVCLTYRGADTLESYLLAKRRAIESELAKAEQTRAGLEEELREVSLELNHCQGQES